MPAKSKMNHHTGGDVATLFAMWAEGRTKAEIAVRFEVSTSTIYDWAQRYRLPRRKIDYVPVSQEPPAPSPEDEAASLGGLALSPWVEARARELRERHYQQRKSEKDNTTIGKVSAWRRGEYAPQGARA